MLAFADSWLTWHLTVYKAPSNAFASLHPSWAPLSEVSIISSVNICNQWRPQSQQPVQGHRVLIRDVKNVENITKLWKLFLTQDSSVALFFFQINSEVISIYT